MYVALFWFGYPAFKYSWIIIIITFPLLNYKGAEIKKKINQQNSATKAFDNCYNIIKIEDSDISLNWFMVESHTSDIWMTYEYIRVTYEWNTST